MALFAPLVGRRLLRLLANRTADSRFFHQSFSLAHRETVKGGNLLPLPAQTPRKVQAYQCQTALRRHDAPNAVAPLLDVTVLNVNTSSHNKRYLHATQTFPEETEASRGDGFAVAAGTASPLTNIAAKIQEVEQMIAAVKNRIFIVEGQIEDLKSQMQSTEVGAEKEVWEQEVLQRLSEREEQLRDDKQLRDKKAALLQWSVEAASPPAHPAVLITTATKDNLGDLTWKKPTVPETLHDAEPFAPYASKVMGSSVRYQPPLIFEAAYLNMTAVCRTRDPTRLGRDFYKVFIDGGSGSGKTRMGWELHKRLAADVGYGRLQVHKVHYVPVLQGPEEADLKAPDNGGQWGEDKVKWAYYEKVLAGHIVRTMTEEELIDNEASLRDVLRHLLALQNGERGAVVLHIDEFHRTPQVTKDLLSTVRTFSQHNPDMLFLAVCTGLYMDPSFDTSGGSPGYVKLHHLSYLPSAQATWNLVKAAATAATCGELSAAFTAHKLEDCKHDLLRYLVEDLRGWPLAAVTLGAALPVAFRHHGLQLSAFRYAEEEVFRQLRSKYNIATLRKMLGLSEAALLKLALLALSPFTVLDREPVSGGVVRDIRKYGLIDPQGTPSGIKLVMSKPLLRLVLEESKALEQVLTLGGTTLPPNSLPKSALEAAEGKEETSLSNLLVTCRGYDFNTGESVQLVSWLVAMYAWLLLEHRPSRTMSLAALRQGAVVLGNKAVAETEPAVFTAALRAVDDAGVAAFKNSIAEGQGGEAASIAKTEARAKMALSHCPRLVSRTRQVRVGEAAIMGTHEKADDAAVALADLALIMQFKGKTTGVAAAQPGGDTSTEAGLVKKYLETMAEKPIGEFEGGLALELLTLSRAPSAATVLTGSTVGLDHHYAATLANVEIKLDDKCGLVVTRELVPLALGDIFGGIAVRCG